MHKAWRIFINTLPILIMIGLIPIVRDDYWLTLCYVVIIIISLLMKWERNDLTVFTFGFIMMIIFESFFVATGVEVFERHTLLGFIPLWLPFLWGYGFIAIKRGVEIVGS